MDCPDAIMDLEDVSSENRGSDDEDDDKRVLRTVSDLLNVTLDVLRATGAGRKLQTMTKYKGEVGELAALLVDKWKQNVINEEQRRVKIAQKELPGELSEADAELNTTVTACKYGSSGYETLGKLGLAIINQEEADWYQLLLFRPMQSTVTVVNITSKFIFLVHRNNFQL